MESHASQPPRRILMTADAIGGVWTYALELIRALEPHGLEFTLATMGSRLSPAQTREARTLANLEIRESNFKLEWMQDPWNDVARAGDWLLEVAQECQPDLIHLNGYCHGALPWPAPVLIVAHSCVLSWWQAVKKERAPREYEHYRAAVTEGIHAADLVVAPSHAMLSMLEEHYGFVRASEVIYNGRRLDTFRSGTKEDLVFTAGRLWDEAKNLATMAAVAPQLPWPIHIAGETERPGDSKSKLNGLHALGRLSPEELAPWFARASIYALPARYEPFGLSALEAGLAGCALVLGDIASLREIWDEAAIFVSPDDPAALGAALKRLISDRAQLNDIARRAHRRALEFAPKKMAAQYLTAYSRLSRGRMSESKELVPCES